MFTKKERKTKQLLTEPKEQYNLAWHRVSVNGWSIERLIKASLYSHEQTGTEWQTIAGEWSEDETKAFYYHWNWQHNGNLCASVRHYTRWVIDGKTFLKYQDAFDYFYYSIMGKVVVELSETLI